MLCRTVWTGNLSRFLTDRQSHMLITSLCRSRSRSKIFRILRRASRIIAANIRFRQQTGLRTNRCLRNIGWFCKIFRFKIRMNPFHHGSPQILRISGTELLGVIIVSAPYNACIVWCKSCKKCITVACRCTRLTSLCHTSSKVCTHTGSACHNIFHCIGQKPGGVLLDDSVMILRLRIVKDHISVMIQYLRVKTRFNVFPFVCNRGIGTGQFQIRHPLC